MSAVVSKAATRCLAGTSSSSIAPSQKRALSTSSKRTLPLYFYSDHSPHASTSTSASASASYSHNTGNPHSTVPDIHAHSAGMHSLRAAGDLGPQTVQHAFDPPPAGSAPYVFGAVRHETQRVYRPDPEEYDYMGGGSGYGKESGLSIKK